MSKIRFNHLLVEIGKGNNKAFESFYNETVNGIYALLYPYFKNSYDTEDAIQEVYMLVKQKAHLYKKDTDARAWLFQVAKNHALNMVRSKTRENVRLEELGKTITPPKDTKWDSTLFLVMQHTLTEEEYQIVVKHVLFFYKHKDIAAELGLPLGTVLSKYQTALNKLREELDYERH